MRTTIEIPDELFRHVKASAALRGMTLKDLVIQAIEREYNNNPPKKRPTTKLPVLPWKGKKKLDLSKFNFDDLLS